MFQIELREREKNAMIMKERKFGGKKERERIVSIKNNRVK